MIGIIILRCLSRRDIVDRLNKSSCLEWWPGASTLWVSRIGILFSPQHISFPTLLKLNIHMRNFRCHHVLYHFNVLGKGLSRDCGKAVLSREVCAATQETSFRTYLLLYFRGSSKVAEFLRSIFETRVSLPSQLIVIIWTDGQDDRCWWMLKSWE